jgi:hypothetical protein
VITGISLGQNENNLDASCPLLIFISGSGREGMDDSQENERGLMVETRVFLL